jgi:hypothetical protein
MARRFLLALALAVLAGCLAACGVRTTIDPVADAATKSQNAGGYKTTMSITVSADGKQLTMTGAGQFGPQSGELDMDLSGVLGRLGSSGSDGSLKTRYLTEDGDPVIYLNLGFLSAFLPGAKTWVRMDLAKAGKAAGIDLSRLMGGTQNPADSLELLRSRGEFSEVGTETVAGVETTHYHGTIDLQKAAAASGAPADVIQRLVDSGAPTQYPADVWIDDQGYIRQFETSYDMTQNGKAESMSLKMSMSDYGTTVDVSAPPADQVFDVTELATQGITSQLSPSSTH